MNHTKFIAPNPLVYINLLKFISLQVGDYVFATIVGLYTGTLVALMTPITIQMVKLKHLSAAHGLEVFFCGIGFTVGPPVAGMFIGLGREVVEIKVC